MILDTTAADENGSLTNESNERHTIILFIHRVRSVIIKTQLVLLNQSSNMKLYILVLMTYYFI